MTDHRHRWIGVDFYLDGERPMLRQTCTCGAERRLRAFSRYWEPDEAVLEAKPERRSP
jgi:hypothetical protein